MILFISICSFFSAVSLRRSYRAELKIIMSEYVSVQEMGYPSHLSQLKPSLKSKSSPGYTSQAALKIGS